MVKHLPPIGAVFSGRYHLEAILGEGGFSMVYAATDTTAKRRVAVKMLKPQKNGYPEEVSSRFRREVKVVANLTDPHTVTMFDSGVSEDGLLFMVFEYVPGEDLSRFIDKRGAIPEGDAIYIMVQVLQSLREAHRAGLLHRDIKPENIRVYEYAGDPLRVKLLDFGIARPTTSEASRITRPGELVGTPRYMSPEQLLEKELTPASDIYSLGLVMLELLLGRALLHGNTWSDQVHRLADGHVFELPGSQNITPLLRQIVLRMSARQPDARYQDASQILRDLGYQASSDQLRRSALNDLIDAAPTSPRLDVSADDFPPPAQVAPTTIDESFELATTWKQERWQPDSSATTPTPPTAPTPEAKPGRVLNPLHVLVALLCGAISALLLVVFVIWQNDSSDRGSGEDPPHTNVHRPVPFVKSEAVDVPTTAAAVAAAIDAGTSADLPPGPPNGTVGCGRPADLRGPFDPTNSSAGHVAYIPRDYDPNVPHPVMFMFHDAGQSPADQVDYAGFADLADREGVVVLAPKGEETFDGTGLYLRVWEGQDALAPAYALWNVVSADFCLDRSRVFAVGHAAGGYAAHKLACEFPLAGMAFNAHVKVTSDQICEPKPPIPTIFVIGREDGYSPSKGGLNCANSQKLSWKDVDKRWKKINGCRGGPKPMVQRPEGQCHKWTCSDAAAYARCDIDGGREWPGTRPMLWDRFNQNCGGYPGSFPSIPTIWEFFAKAPSREVEAQP